MRQATMRDLDAIGAAVSAHKQFFPHVRADYLQRMVEGGNCIWERGVFITFNRYSRAQRIGNFSARKGDVILHQIGATVQGDGSARDVLARFFEWVDANVVLAVRADNERACAFYESMGMTQVGTTEWKNGELPGRVYMKRKEETKNMIKRTNAQLHPSKLTPHPDNPRSHTEEQIRTIADSIDQFGFTAPIIATDDGVIIAGHGRHMAAEQLQLKKVPVVLLHGLTDSQVKALMVSDNRLTELSEWDDAKLEEVLTSLNEEDFPLATIGYDAWEPYKDEEEDADKAAANKFLRYNEDTILDAAYKHYRETGFPYKELALHQQMQEINALRARAPDESLLNSTLCYDVADTYHRHRFHGHAARKNSPVDSFGIAKRLKRALRLQLEATGKINTGWFGALALVSNTQACANFRPAFAKYLYNRYCDKKAPRVLDTSTGYGGRMLGFICAFDRGKYVGIDPSTLTHKANLAMAKALKFDDRIELINLPAEDVKPFRASFDFAFTSPPYFSKERYTEEKTQSWVRYPQADGWREGFLIPMLRLQFKALKKGAYNIVNIADVAIDSKTYPLVEWTLTDAAEVGFEFVEKLEFPLQRRFGANMDEAVATEPVLVFRKK